MLWDTHMHSQFSGDSHTPQEDMIAAAKQKNLKGICFTDHLDIDYPDEPETFLLDLPNYVSSVDAMQEKYKEVLPVRLGIELGLQPHLACIHADILSQYPFDFVIGSSHVMHGVDLIIRLIGKITRRRKAIRNILNPFWKISQFSMVLTSMVTSTTW